MMRSPVLRPPHHASPRLREYGNGATKCNGVQHALPLTRIPTYVGRMETVPHILVVDDDREIRELLARFLERNRFRVTAVRDAREARRAWADRAFPPASCST